MMLSHINLNKVGLCGKNFNGSEKNSFTYVLLPTLPRIWISISWSTNNNYTCQQQDGYIFHDSFLSLLSNQYISNLYNLYNLDVNLSLASQTICDHMFPDPQSDHISPFFCCVLGLYIFLLVCGHFPLT